MHNNVRELRRASGMTQAALAKVAYTTQRQIQRIESGAEFIRLDIANAVALALKSPISGVFPPISPPDMDYPGAFPELEEFIVERFDNLNHSRFEAPEYVHRLLVSLRGGHHLELPVSQYDANRFQRFLLDPPIEMAYIVLSSHCHQVAINRSHVTRAQICFDRVPASFDLESQSTSLNQTSNLEEDNLVTFMATEPEPVFIQVEPDYGDLESDEQAELARLFFFLECCLDDLEYLPIEDVDGETAIFSLEDLAAIAIHVKWLGGNFDVWSEYEP